MSNETNSPTGESINNKENEGMKLTCLVVEIDDQLKDIRALKVEGEKNLEKCVVYPVYTTKSKAEANRKVRDKGESKTSTKKDKKEEVKEKEEEAEKGE